MVYLINHSPCGGTTFLKLTHCNSFEFNHRGVLSCHTFSTQSVVQAVIITIDVCLIMQSNLMGSLLGAYFQLIFMKQKHMQIV